MDISKLLDGRVSKQVGSHFFESVLPRTLLYLESIGKTSKCLLSLSVLYCIIMCWCGCWLVAAASAVPGYKELSEEEIEQLVTYLQVRRSSSTVSIHKVLCMCCHLLSRPVTTSTTTTVTTCGAVCTVSCSCAVLCCVVLCC